MSLIVLNWTLFFVMLILDVLDSHSTHMLLTKHKDKAKEANPIIIFLFNRIGMIPTYVLTFCLILLMAIIINKDNIGVFIGLILSLIIKAKVVKSNYNLLNEFNRQH